MNESQLNQSAFEQVSDVWEFAGGVGLPVRSRKRRTFGALTFACVAALVAAPFCVWWWSASTTIQTGVGEHRSLQLADGSTVVMSPETRIAPRFSDNRRLVLLVRGEAAFAVTKDSLRPFVVSAGDARVVAIGTKFDVRWMNGALAVTLSEGRVHVIDESDGRLRKKEVELTPGERLERIRPGADAKVVRVEAPQAALSDRMDFEELSLAEAAARMNRYSERKIVIAGAARDIRISGSFRAGDNARFARAIEDLYGLRATFEDDRILVSARTKTADQR